MSSQKPLKQMVSESDEDVPMPENWGMQRQEMVTSQPESVGFATLPS